ncbi:MAG: M48 family metallopeptidase [Hyphomicrobiaceae bacterium]|nr:M48 family metallopeptidase [Hyphomicrobiaceae bacterium]
MDTESDGRRFEGRFSNGKSADSARVTVGLGRNGLLIELPGAAEPLVWPYGALQTAEPLTANAIDALVTYTHQPDATLFVPGGPFARALAERAPQTTARAERWRHTRPWLWGVAGLVGVLAVVWASGLSPARSIAGLLPESARDALGEQVIGSMTRGKTVCTAPAGRAAIDQLAQRLSAATNRAVAFDITVVEWGLVNAFAAPGEQIVLTSGIIEAVEGPDELAGVLAHEMGHGLEMHPETGIVRAIGLTAAAELVLGGSAGTLTNLGLVLAQLSYTRSAEREADDHALAILRGAGISAKGLSDFFARVAKLEGAGSGRMPDALRSHPQSEERLARVRSQPSYPATPSLDATQWRALRAICADGKS